MVVNVEIRGLNEVSKFLADLPKKIEKEIDDTNGLFMKNVRRSAIARVPRATGVLANSIILKKTNKNEWKIIVDSPYAAAQEFGFTPHIIPIEYIEQHLGNPGARGRFVKNPTAFVMVSKSHPFLMPALEMNLSNLTQMLDNAAKKAIGGSK